MLAVVVFFVIISLVAAFSPIKNFARARVSPLKDSKDSTYWEGKAPPSKVLGVGEKIPSAVFGPLSLVAFAVGTYCIHESNIFHQITVDTINPVYIGGSALVPISWGMHVAAWIQKQNGK